MITPTLGSIVQKGKLADCALAFDKQLKRVDLPTFGRPTIPHLSAISLLYFILFYGTAKLLQTAKKCKHLAVTSKKITTNYS